MTEPPQDHLKALWKGQEPEIQPMSVEAIRARVVRYQLQVRRRTIAALIVGLFSGGFFAWCAWIAPTPMVRLGDLIMIAGVPWMLWLAWRRGPRALPGGSASGRQLIDFHRGQLLRQKQSFRAQLMLVAPVLAGAAVVLLGLHLAAPNAPVAQYLPIAGLFCLWLVAFWFLARRQRRAVQAQIDELDAQRDG
jgi:hypothetical protein